MTLYEDSAFPIPTDLTAIHSSQLGLLGAPGTWGTGAQRLAVATEARNAGYEAGVLEPPDGGEATSDEPPSDESLPDAARRVVRRLAVSPQDMDQGFYDEALEGGLTDAEYVEIVGLVARVCDMDVFARGIGVPLRPLPPPQEGQPSRERPEAAIPEQAWVPMIPNPPDGGAFADALYRGSPKPNIVRALSLVPAELRAHVELEEIQYLPLNRILEPEYSHHEGLTRAQVEIVAGRVSALNECFY